MTKEEKRYKEWITTLPCCVCESPGVEHENGKQLNNPCHITSKGAGGKIFGNLLPMCQIHHNQSHRWGWPIFMERYPIGPWTLGLKYQREYDRINGK